MYCCYQSKQALFPRGNVFGHCFDNSQRLEYKLNISGAANQHRSILSQNESRLELPLASNPVSFIDTLTFAWGIFHISILFLLLAFPITSFFLEILQRHLIVTLCCYLFGVFQKFQTG